MKLNTSSTRIQKNGMGWIPVTTAEIKSRVFTSDDPFMMSVQLKLDEVLLRMLDDDFNLSEGEPSDEEGGGISSYLGDSIIDLNTVMSMSKVEAPDLSSSETIHSDFMNGEKNFSEEESSLIASVVFS